MVCTILSGTLKSTLDCKDGYHGVPLALEDRHKTTFIREQGRFPYARAPQGYGSSNDGYTQRTDTILRNCPEKPEKKDYDKIVDDIIQWSDTVEQSFIRICNILAHCSRAGMVFNPTKFYFAKEEIQYAGFIIGKDSIRHTDSYLQAILEFSFPAEHQ